MEVTSTEPRQTMSSRASALAGAWPLVPVLVAMGLLWCWRLGETYSHDYDEGVYLAGTREMLHGAIPFRDFFSSQPPLYPWLLRIGFAIGGDQVASGRAVSVVFALLACLAVFEIARSVSGRGAVGTIAVLLCACAPLWMRMGHVCQAEAPALALALAALDVVVDRRRASSPAWQVTAGLLFGMGISTKLLVAPMIAPALFWAQGWTGRARILGATAALATALALPHGLGAVLEQAVGFHLVALHGANEHTALRELWGTPALLALLAVIGCAVLRRERRELLGMALWVASCAVFLVVHHPVFPHHLVLLVPALAVPAAASWAALQGRAVRGLAMLPVLVLAAYTGIAEARSRPAGPEETRAMQLIQEHSLPDEPVASDDQMLVFRAGRRTPSALVDTSLVRIRTGSLTLEQVQRGTIEARLLVPWTGRLSAMGGFAEWLRSRCDPLVARPAGEKDTLRGVYACR
jgi:4-amino-4-deoxy-L-arabinose transferase-like glycosyltransferase